MKIFILLLINLTLVFAQSKPAMVGSNNLKEIEARIQKQRTNMIELDKVDAKRKQNNNFRNGRKETRNRAIVEKRILVKKEKVEKRSKKETIVKEMVTKKINTDKKFQRARRFREKDTHISKEGVRGFKSRIQKLPFRPLPGGGPLPKPN